MKGPSNVDELSLPLSLIIGHMARADGMLIFFSCLILQLHLQVLHSKPWESPEVLGTLKFNCKYF